MSDTPKIQRTLAEIYKTSYDTILKEMPPTLQKEILGAATGDPVLSKDTNEFIKTVAEVGEAVYDAQFVIKNEKTLTDAQPSGKLGT
jgi:hypothetical protein